MTEGFNPEEHSAKCGLQDGDTTLTSCSLDNGEMGIEKKKGYITQPRKLYSILQVSFADAIRRKPEQKARQSEYICCVEPG